MNRGSPAACRRARATSIGFNEAPIHESGKLAAGSGASQGVRRFNEAPIHESGKSHPPTAALR